MQNLSPQHRRERRYRPRHQVAPSRRLQTKISLAVAVLMTLGVGALVASGPSSADVTAVTGSAFGFSSNISLFGGPFVAKGPAPTVTLPPGGSATPVTATDPSEDAVYGPAHIFTSGPVTVSTQGTTGPTGSVTSSTSIAGCVTAVTNSCSVGQIFAGPFTATSMSSMCTAGASLGGSTSIVGGQLLDGTNTIAIAASPPPNDTHIGTNPDTGAMYKWIFNEQIMNPDGSLTVNAGHEVLGFGGSGSAKGDLIIGSVTCGITGSQATTTTTSTSTTVPSTTTTTSTTVPSTTTTSTTVPSTTTTTSTTVPGTTTTTSSTVPSTTTTSTTVPSTTTTTVPSTTTTTIAPPPRLPIICQVLQAILRFFPFLARVLLPLLARLGCPA